MSNSQRTPLNPAKPSPRRTLTLVRHLQPDIAAQVCYGRSDIAQRGPQTAATEQLVQHLSALQQTRQFDGSDGGRRFPSYSAGQGSSGCIIRAI